MLPIQRKLIKYNFTRGNSKEYLVVHATSNRSSSATALNHYNYFNGGNRNSSAHYFIDTNNIIQLVDDNNASWAVGDGKGKYGIRNNNSISIEMCMNDMKNIETVVDHTVDLTVHLMKKHNIPLDKLVRHFDCSRKICPDIFAPNNWAKWVEFKTLVAVRLKGGGNKMKKEEVIAIVKEILHPGIVEGKPHWSDEHRESLANKGILLSDNRPNDYMKRAEVITLVSNAVNQTLKIAMSETKKLID